MDVILYLKMNLINIRNMRNLLLLCFILFLFPTVTLIGQVTVWPGDVNNNGVVDELDLLYLGPQIGQTGPARATVDISWSGFGATLWGNMPGTTIDMAFADTNGDGQITQGDVDAISANFLQEHGTVVPINAPTPNINSDPYVFFDESSLPAIIEEGQLFSLPIFIGNEFAQLELNGISFKITYNEEILDVIESSAFFSPWFDPGWMNSSQVVEYLDGEVYVSLSSMEGISGFGLLGVLDFVVEDDVIGINDPDIFTGIEVERVYALNDEFNAIPLNTDTAFVNISSPLSVATETFDPLDLKFFPNPTKDLCYLTADSKINSIKVYDFVGKCVLTEQVGGNSHLLKLGEFSPGVYNVEVITNDGHFFRKLLKQ